MSIEQIEKRAGIIGFSRPKITIFLRQPTQQPQTPASGTLASSVASTRFDAATPAPTGGLAASLFSSVFSSGTPALASTSQPFMRLSFPSNVRDTFFAALTDALREGAWTTAVSPNGAAASAARRTFDTSQAGVHGLIRSVQQRNDQADRSIDLAFQDLSALISSAKELVDLAQKYSATLQARKGECDPATQSTDQEHFNDLLAQMGIPNPVTRQSAGTVYHQQLSRELAAYLAQPLERAGGMLNLIDVYCLYNRARGTQLISPDDLLHACKLFAPLGLPITLRKFDTGVTVLQSAQHSDEAMSLRIVAELERRSALLSPPEGDPDGAGKVQRASLSALEASMWLKLSVTVASQHLLTAERLGLLCRDECLEGLRFYQNPWT